MQLAGVMIFGMHTDDYDSDCGTGTYPLINAIRDALYSNATRRTKHVKYRKNQIYIINE